MPFISPGTGSPARSRAAAACGAAHMGGCRSRDMERRIRRDLTATQCPLACEAVRQSVNYHAGAAAGARCACTLGSQTPLPGPHGWSPPGPLSQPNKARNPAHRSAWMEPTRSCTRTFVRSPRRPRPWPASSSASSSAAATAAPPPTASCVGLWLWGGMVGAAVHLMLCSSGSAQGAPVA